MEQRKSTPWTLLTCDGVLNFFIYFCKLLSSFYLNKVPQFFVFLTSYYEFSLLMQQHKLGKFKEVKYLEKHIIHRCIQSPAEHLRWSFFRKQLTAESRKSQMFDWVLNRPLLHVFFIRKPFFWLSINLLNIALKIRLRFS